MRQVAYNPGMPWQHCRMCRAPSSQNPCRFQFPKSDDRRVRPYGAECVVDRVPEENAELPRFLDGALPVLGRTMTPLEGMPDLGVMRVETDADPVSIGYDVARQ